MRSWLLGTWSVLAKDLQLEFRARYAVNMLLMFVVTSLFVVYLGIGDDPITPGIRSGLLWIVVFFSAALGLARAFVSEEESGTILILRLHVRGSMVYVGKLAFNYLLLLGVNLVATLGFALLLEMQVEQVALLAFVLATGSLGLAAATTLLSAMIARASTRGPLLPVIAFPILFPLLMTIIPAARAALEGGGGWAAAAGDIRVMLAFAGTVITGAILLFDYIWED